MDKEMKEASERVSSMNFCDDLVNVYASKDNPRKYCIFVRRLSEKRLVRVTDGKGEFWDADIRAIHKRPTLKPLKTVIHR